MPVPAEARAIQAIAVDDIALDPDNPRLPEDQRRSGEPSIIAWLHRNADVGELMLSIGGQGYFEGEPLLVTPEGAPEGKYIVVEGNCRVAAVKLLANPRHIEGKVPRSVMEAAAEASHKPTQLPCMVFQERREILKYLGYRHVTGIHPWDALQKARYLRQLRTIYPMPADRGEQYRQLAREIGSRSDYVAKLLTGLKLVEVVAEKDFFKIDGLDEEKLSFSLLTTALSYSAVCRFLGLEGPTDEDAAELDPQRLRELMVWLFHENSEGRTRLGESRNLKTLAAVVSNGEALKRFREGDPLDEAENWTSLPEENFRDALSAALGALERARDVVHRVQRTTDLDIQRLKELNQIVLAIHAIAKERQAGDQSLGAI